MTIQTGKPIMLPENNWIASSVDLKLQDLGVETDTDKIALMLVVFEQLEFDAKKRAFYVIKKRMKNAQEIADDILFKDIPY